MRRTRRPVDALVRWWSVGLAVALATTLLATPVTHAQTRDPLLEFLQAVAAVDDLFVVLDGERTSVVDPANDQTNPAGVPPVLSVPQNDIRVEDHVTLDPVAGALFLDLFACDNGAGTICSAFGSDPAAFTEGMVVVYQGLADDPRLSDPGSIHEWAILGRDPDFPPPPIESGRPNDPFAGAVSHQWRLRTQGDTTELALEIFADGQFGTFRTHARAVLTADGIFWLMPLAQEWDQLIEFDLYAGADDGDATGFDALRQPPVRSGSMLPVTPGPLVTFVDEPPPTPTASPTAAPTAPTAPTASLTPGASVDATAQTSPLPSATPEPGETPTAGDGGPPWQILLLLGGVLAVIALGFRFRRFWAPDGPTGAVPPSAPPPPQPPPRPALAPPPSAGACADGDEDWRDDAPPGDFLVPDRSQKVLIAIDPVAPALEAWLDAFGDPRGIPIDAFVGIDDDAIARLFAGRPSPLAGIEGELVIPLSLRELQCQRRWVCQDAAWESTAERRMVEATPSPVPRTFRFDGPDGTVDDVIRTWRDAVEVLRAAEAQAGDAERYRADCV